MSKVQLLRALVNQRLSAAAEEIFELFEGTLAEYEEEICRSKEENERQQKLLDAVFNPEVRVQGSEVEQLIVRNDEDDPPEQQKRRFCLDQDDPPEDQLWSSREGEQLQGSEEADVSMVSLFHVPVKTEEEEDGEKPQSSQLHENQSEESRDSECLKTESDGEDCGGAEPGRDFNPDSHLQPDTPEETSHFFGSDTDDSGDWEESDELPEGLNPVQNNSVLVSDMNCNTEDISVISPECSTSYGPHKPLKNNEIHTGKKPFISSVCAERHQSKKHLQNHMIHHSAEKPFSCAFCKKSFIWRAEMVRHMRVHTGEKPFSCLVCGKRFTQSGDLKRHSVVHTGEKPFSCAICGHRFTNSADLKRHYFVHTGEKRFSCSVCGQRFTRNAALKRHVIVHTGEKPFSCSVCGQRFTQSGALKRHFVVHSGEKPFSCSFCDKTFTRSGALKRHYCHHRGETSCLFGDGSKKGLLQS